MMPTGQGAVSAQGTASAVVEGKESKKGAIKLGSAESKKKTASKRKPAAKAEQAAGPAVEGGKMSTKTATAGSTKLAPQLAPLKPRPGLASAESKKGGELPPLKVASPKHEQSAPSPQPGPGGTGSTSSGDAAAAQAKAARESKIAGTGGASSAASAALAATAEGESKRGGESKAADPVGPITGPEVDAVAEMVAKLTEEEKAMFRKEFERFDADGSGYISLDEFGEVIKTLGADVPENELSSVYNNLDSNGDGQLDFTEFMALMVNFMQPSTVDELKEAFMCFDEDNSGSVSREELEAVFKILGESCPITTEDADRLFKDADRNGDGQLDYEEFARYLLPDQFDDDPTPSDPQNGGGGTATV